MSRLRWYWKYAWPNWLWEKTHPRQAKAKRRWRPMTEDYTRLINVIVAHRVTSVLSLEETNAIFFCMFRAQRAGKPAPHFSALLREVLR